MKFFMRFFFALVLFLPIALYADSNAVFNTGLQFYRQGKYPEAISSWESINSSGLSNSETYYNLGNAYFRTQNIGKAILNYERALNFSPRDEDIKHNLTLVRLGAVDKIEPSLRLGLWEYVDRVRDYFSLNELATLFYLFSLISVIALLAVRFSSYGIRRFLKPVSMLMVSCFIIFGSWYFWRATLDSRKFGIITTAKSDVYSGPDQTSTQVFTLHEGTKVRLNEALTGWIKIRLDDGRQGWMQASDLTNI